MKLVTKIYITSASVFSLENKFLVFYKGRTIFSDDSLQACVGIALNKVLMEEVYENQAAIC